MIKRERERERLDKWEQGGERKRDNKRRKQKLQDGHSGKTRGDNETASLAMATRKHITGQECKERRKENKWKHERKRAREGKEGREVQQEGFRKQ